MDKGTVPVRNVQSCVFHGNGCFVSHKTDENLADRAEETYSDGNYARAHPKTTDPGPLGAEGRRQRWSEVPDVSKPDTNDLLKRMKKVDPNQSKRYRQRTGQ